jgi:hypothetical protein
MKKKFSFLVLFSLFLGSLLIYGCIPPQIYEFRSLDLDYELEDNNLLNPPRDITDPTKGYHRFERYSEVTLREVGSSGYGVSSWIAQDMETGLRIVSEGPFFRLLMDNNYQVTAIPNCMNDDVCRYNFKCVDRVCVFEDD